LTQGATVFYQGAWWEVQYINSKGLLDLKRVDGSGASEGMTEDCNGFFSMGEQLYGINPATLQVAQAYPPQGQVAQAYAPGPSQAAAMAGQAMFANAMATSCS
jgi:hypothetical protein